MKPDGGGAVGDADVGDTLIGEVFGRNVPGRRRIEARSRVPPLDHDRSARLVGLGGRRTMIRVW